MPRLTVQQRIDMAVAAAIAQLQSAPASTATVRTFATKAERAAGNGFPCTAPVPCSRHDLRTTTRASVHGVDKGGHEAR